MPALAIMAAVASPLVSVLLTDKWLPCVPFMQILCLSFMFSPVETENLQSIKAIGRSDIVLKLEIIKRFSSIILLICAIPLGLHAIAWSMVIGNMLAAIFNASPNCKLLGYSIIEQLSDVLPSLCISVLVFISSYSFVYFNSGIHVWWQLLGGITIGALVYLIFSWAFRVEAFYYIYSVLRNHKNDI